MKKLISTFIIASVCVMNSVHAAPAVNDANVPQYEQLLQEARNKCGGIGAQLNSIKNMAGINTVVTGVGTVAAGGALIAGINKNKIDKQAEELEKQMADIANMSDKDFLRFLKNMAAYEEQLQTYQSLCSKKKSLDAKSKKMGNIRTGLMATNTATAVAGTVIASKNKNDTRPIIEIVSECLATTEKMNTAIGQARVDGQDYYHEKLQRIQSTCGKFYTKNLEKISSKSNVAMISSAVNIGTGTVGTITSAVANTDKTRKDNTESGKQKEKNLNNAANIFAGASGVASGVSTVFNALTLKAVNDNIKTATECEEALQ